MFSYEENGYQENILIRESHSKSQTRTKVHIYFREFIAFRIQQRPLVFGNIVNACRLLQQFLVDY